MSAIASQITSLTSVHSTVYSDGDQTKHQSSASVSLCARNSLVTGEFLAQRPVTRKIFPFHDVFMIVLQTVHTVIKLPHLYGPKYLLVENNFLHAWNIWQTYPVIIMSGWHTCAMLPWPFLDQLFRENRLTYLISSKLLNSYLPPEINEYVTCNCFTQHTVSRWENVIWYSMINE